MFQICHLHELSVIAQLISRETPIDVLNIRSLSHLCIKRFRRIKKRSNLDLLGISDDHQNKRSINIKGNSHDVVFGAIFV